MSKRLPRSQRLRRYVAVSQLDNRRQNAAGDVDTIERRTRQRLAAEDPAASVEAIEERVARAMAAGAKPSVAAAPAPAPAAAKKPARRVATAAEIVAELGRGDLPDARRRALLRQARALAEAAAKGTRKGKK